MTDNPRVSSNWTQDPTPIQQEYAQRLKQRLAQPTITVEDARDGILDCFVATYHQGVAQGLDSMLSIQGSDEQVAGVTATMFRNKLSAAGGSFQNPTVESLAAVKEAVDEEFHFGSLPAETKALHDQVCNLLLSKASGDLPHAGNRSVVGASPEEEAAAAAPAPDSAPQPTSSAAPTPAAMPLNDSGSVSGSLRQALANYLYELAGHVLAGEPAGELAGRADRIHELIQTIDTFES